MASVLTIISTLWRVGDIASALYGPFYGYLKDEAAVLDSKRLSDALHVVIQKLREQGEEPIL
jgi:hypothetical protein